MREAAAKIPLGDGTENHQKRVFTVGDIVRLTNFTRRQVDYLKAEGLLRPFLSSHKACGRKPSSYFQKCEMVKAVIFSEMKRRGFSMQQIRKVAGNLEEFETALGQSHTYLLTDGHSIFLAERNHQVVDILRNSGQMLLIPLAESLQKLEIED